MATRGIGRRGLFFAWVLVIAPAHKANPLDGMRLWA
jgi:hypothetical protein